MNSWGGSTDVGKILDPTGQRPTRAALVDPYATRFAAEDAVRRLCDADLAELARAFAAELRHRKIRQIREAEHLAEVLEEN